MSSTSPRLELPYLQPSQAQKHVTHNEAIKQLDALAQLTIASFEAQTPPQDPANGDIYALGNAPTDAWSGKAHTLAEWDEQVWWFVTPRAGWCAYDLSELRLMVFSGGQWTPETQSMQDLDGVGIGTAFDPLNRLSVAAPATLLSHDGAGHQLKINKSAPGDTASLLFQSNWTGHAEMGLSGDTAFSLKASADGQAWFEMLRADPSDEEVAFAANTTVQMRLRPDTLRVDVPISGSAVQSNAQDITPSLLTTVKGSKSASLSTHGLYYPSTATENVDLLMPGAVGLFSTQASGTWPDEAGSFLWVETQRMFSGNSMRQVATQYSRDVLQAPRQWIRVQARESVPSPWTPWREIYNQSSILGAVSESGGIPTGAVIERGGNANGTYIRFADGTQICQISRDVTTTTTPLGGLHRSDTDFGIWSYPATFAEAPHLQTNIQHSECWGSAHGDTPSALAGVTLFSALPQSATTISVSVQATGRWF